MNPHKTDSSGSGAMQRSAIHMQRSAIVIICRLSSVIVRLSSVCLSSVLAQCLNSLPAKFHSEIRRVSA